MKERIKMIMESENMTPARFADHLQIGRAVISHILNGRNNPSLDVITRILNEIPKINSDWLLTGIGNMYKGDSINQNEQKVSNQLLDLFSQTLETDEILKNPTNYSENPIHSKENIVNTANIDTQDSVKERIIYRESPAKKVKQIIIYYTDNTFETFGSAN